MSNQDYAEMIEMPVSTYETFVKSKKPVKGRGGLFKLFGKQKDDGEQSGLFEEENGTDLEFEDYSKEESGSSLDKEESGSSLDKEETESSSKKENGKNCGDSKTSNEKGGFKWNIVTAQVITIFVLAIGLLVTNIFWQDSGINNLLRTVFSENEVVETDDRTYVDFDAVSPAKDLVEVENGIMTIKNGGAIYSPADGKVVSVSLVDGKYTVTISHSDNYRTIISGADYSYVIEGDKVFTTTPVCYGIESGVEVAMYDSDSIITAFALQEGKIVWQK